MKKHGLGVPITASKSENWRLVLCFKLCSSQTHALSKIHAELRLLLMRFPHAPSGPAFIYFLSGCSRSDHLDPLHPGCFVPRGDESFINISNTSQYFPFRKASLARITNFTYINTNGAYLNILQGCLPEQRKIASCLCSSTPSTQPERVGLVFANYGGTVDLRTAHLVRGLYFNPVKDSMKLSR